MSLLSLRNSTTSVVHAVMSTCDILLRYGLRDPRYPLLVLLFLRFFSSEDAYRSLAIGNLKSIY